MCVSALTLPWVCCFSVHVRVRVRALPEGVCSWINCVTSDNGLAAFRWGQQSLLTRSPDHTHAVCLAQHPFARIPLNTIRLWDAQRLHYSILTRAVQPGIHFPDSMMQDFSCLSPSCSVFPPRVHSWKDLISSSQSETCVLTQRL